MIFLKDEREIETEGEGEVGRERGGKREREGFES